MRPDGGAAGPARLTAEERGTLSVLAAAVDAHLRLYPRSDGYVPLPGLQREVICTARACDLLSLGVVASKRPPYPMLADRLWTVTDAGRAALGASAGGSDA